MLAYFLLFLSILTAVAGQVLLKFGMTKRPTFQVHQVLTLVTDWHVVLGVVSYGISTLLYFSVLSSLELSFAYPTVSLGYVFVIIMSKIFFGETITLN